MAKEKSIFGWCHDGIHKICRTRFTTYDREYICECDCHAPAPETTEAEEAKNV